MGANLITLSQKTLALKDVILQPWYIHRILMSRLGLAVALSPSVRSTRCDSDIAGECGLPCGLPTKPPTGHGGPKPEPFRMTPCMVRVSYVPSRTKLLVSEARGQPGIRLHASDEESHVHEW
ncbi:hypothetical protein J6590_044063 [Homalodisca vitripennis]|nr:hypothetical protein J6590_044063 [Homalodisca vitripennis]